MYITNNPEIAKIAEKSGVDRIFVDMEFIGKELRQANMDTVKSHHTFDDVELIKKSISSAELLVRCNPIHNELEDYCSTEDEINEIIKRGADIIMLPYFKTPEEVKRFVMAVGGRVKTMLLIETPEAAENIEEILKIDGIDEVYIGLNDLSLGYGKKFMFELLADGTVEKLAEKIKEYKKPFGFGGMAAMGTGMLPAEKILGEHYRLGSTCVILARSFYKFEGGCCLNEALQVFEKGVEKIREKEKEFLGVAHRHFDSNTDEIKKIVKNISEEIALR